MSIAGVCVTVKIQFDNSSTCKYSIILTLCLASSCVWAPVLKNSGSAPSFLSIFLTTY